MDCKTVKLHFRAPLQLSRGSVDYTDIDEILRSDTIKNALFVCALQLFGKEHINRSFFEQFTISSAFPFSGQSYFFPKPLLRLPLKITDAGNSESKKIKKLQWIEKSLFENIIAGKETAVSKDHFSNDGKFLSLQFASMDRKDRTVCKTEELQRVTVKYDEDAVPFYSSRLHFTAGAGLFVLIQTDDNSSFFEKTLKPAFTLLGDNGIGSYKNLGNGQFDPEFVAESCTLAVPQHATHQICLSLFCPTKDEISNGLLNDASYQLVKRGGYLASPEQTDKMSWRKKSIYMFQEGSVFPVTTKLTGKLADVTPEGLSHNVWRDGKAIFIPVAKNITEP